MIYGRVYPSIWDAASVVWLFADMDDSPSGWTHLIFGCMGRLTIFVAYIAFAM